VIQAHNDVIALGQNTLFNMLFDTQQFVASIILNQPHPPNIAWNADFTKISCSGSILETVRFRSGIQSIIEDTWKLMFSLTGGTKFANKLPESFVDDLPNDTRGYSFLDHGPFVRDPHSFLEYLVNKSRWNVCSYDANQRFSWNIPAVHEILQILGDINKHLSVLCFVLPTMSNRVTQFIDTKLRNLDRPRNLHMLITDMFNLLHYHKMTNLTGLDKCIPAFYPPCLKDLMLEYLCGGMREVDLLLTLVCYGREAATHHKK
jgi:hypothetical protein